MRTRRHRKRILGEYFSREFGRTRSRTINFEPNRYISMRFWSNSRIMKVFFPASIAIEWAIALAIDVNQCIPKSFNTKTKQESHFEKNIHVQHWKSYWTGNVFCISHAIHAASSSKMYVRRYDPLQLPTTRWIYTECPIRKKSSRARQREQ